MNKFISAENLKNVKKIDLFTYLSNYDADELVKESRNRYTTRSHSSLKIDHGLWMWWARGIGGRSALDYLIKVNNMPFLDAALYLENLIKINGFPPLPQPINHKSLPAVLHLPPHSKNNSAIIKYLCSDRCISKRVLDYYIYYNYIYESRDTHSVVFVSYDDTGKEKFACIRETSSTTESNKRDIYGSDKRYSFSFDNYNSDHLHVFESAIDLLSYQTLLHDLGKPWQENNYVSLSGIYLPSEKVDKDITLPIALQEFLLTHTIKKVFLHLDNDKAGMIAAEKISNLLESSYSVVNAPAPSGKDINDYLVLSKQRKSKYKER